MSTESTVMHDECSAWGNDLTAALNSAILEIRELKRHTIELEAAAEQVCWYYYDAAVDEYSSYEVETLAKVLKK